MRPIVAGIAMIWFLTGCASNGTDSKSMTDQMNLEAEVSKLQRELTDRERELARRQDEVSQLNDRLEQASGASGVAGRVTPGSGDLLPPNAKPGECFARVSIPAEYQTTSERVVSRAASERLELIPARYETVDERVLVREASKRLEVIPATYRTVEERVLVSPESTRLESVPAEYATEAERVLVKAAHTVWKKGRGPIERVSDSTGEIMCLVEVPAEYKTVRRRVMIKPPSTRTVMIPAQYKTVQKRIIDRPPSTREIDIPGEYKTVQVRRLVQPAQERRVDIPAEYESVSKRRVVSQSRMEWAPVLCETNASPAVVAQIQRALQSAGHNPGPIDGVIGRGTLDAVAAFQSANRLPRGGLNFETIAALGVKLGQ